MKRPVKIIAVIVMMAVAFAFSPLIALPVNAKTLTGYSASKAIKFARSNKKNNKDCVIFARACAEKGGVPVQDGRGYGYSPDQYAEYLIAEGYAVKSKLTLCDDEIVSGTHKYGNLREEDNPGKMAKGDLLLYKCKKCGKFFHMAILTGTETGVYDDQHYWVICAQSANGQMIKDLPFYRYEHNSHGRGNVEVSVLHFTSSANGFKACKKTVKNLKAKKVTAKKTKLSWKKTSGAVAYNIYACGYAGGPMELQKQVKGTSVKIAVPKNSSGKYYNYKNVRYAVAPVMKQRTVSGGIERTYKVVGKRCAPVSIK